MPAHCVSSHRMYAAAIVINGAAQSGCKTSDINSKRLTSFESKFTIFPGDVSIKDFCDNRKA